MNVISVPPRSVQKYPLRLPSDLVIEATRSDVGRTTNSSAHATAAACLAFGKPYMPVYPGAAFEPSHVATWIVENAIKTLNVDGNREHEEPGIGEKVERFLGDVLEQLGHDRG
jgi:Circularly permutated YpsA SLOG family